MSESGGWMTTLSEPRLIAGRKIVLEARAFRQRLPFGGFVWNRPVAARVLSPSGETRLPIRDVTRRWQLAAYGFSLMCVAAGLSARGRARKE